MDVEGQITVVYHLNIILVNVLDVFILREVAARALLLGVAHL